MFYLTRIVALIVISSACAILLGYAFIQDDWKIINFEKGTKNVILGVWKICERTNEKKNHTCGMFKPEPRWEGWSLLI